MNLPRASLRACLSAVLGLVAGTAAADAWEVVVRDRTRQVEIDRASVIQSDGGTRVAWGRIALSEEEALEAGYATVKALNRYDCTSRSFFTVKRVYLDRRNIVLREESIADQKPIPVARNTVDERLWREVCRPPSVSELRQVAREAGQPAAQTEGGAAARKAAENGPRAAAPRSADLRRAEAPSARAAAGRAEQAKPASPAAAPAVSNRAGSSPPAQTASALGLGQDSAPRAALEQRPSPAAASSAPRPTPMPQQPARATAAAAAASSASGAPAPEVRWSYEGDTGPEYWGRLSPEWALCAEGRRQSPIDLEDGIGVELEPLRFDYRPTRFRAVDTGKTLDVRVGEGMGVEIRGRRYELTQIQLHRPSEARVGGRAYDMAAHLHHRDADGRMAIVAVLLARGERPHPLVQALWNNLPLERGEAYAPAAPIDPATLIPADPDHYLYMGSLTTPPCTEGVLWAVMREPMSVSDEQIRIFARLYPRNSRPLQPANGRLVLQSR